MFCRLGRMGVQIGPCKPLSIVGLPICVAWLSITASRAELLMVFSREKTCRLSSGRAKLHFASLAKNWANLAHSAITLWTSQPFLLKLLSEVQMLKSEIHCLACACYEFPFLARYQMKSHYCCLLSRALHAQRETRTAL